MRTLLVVIAIAWSGQARAESGPADVFGDVAAQPDGSAWLIVGRAATGRVELWHVTPDGAHSVVAPPAQAAPAAQAATADAAHGVVASPAQAVPTAVAISPDGALWLVTGDAVLRLDAAGWVSVARPRPGGARWITPLARARALMLQSCDEPRDGCTDITEVDLAAQTATITRLAVNVAHPVADGSGGAWMNVARGTPPALTWGYVHRSADGWESWSANGLAIDGVRDRGHSDAYPEVIAAAPPGFVGAVAHQLWTIGPDGQPSPAIGVPSSSYDHVDDPRALLVIDGDAVLIAGRHANLRAHGDDPSPVIRRFARATGQLVADERVPTPRWWRTRHAVATPPLRASAGGGSLWIVAEDAVFYRTATGWHALGSPGAGHDADAPSRIQWLASLPVTLGAATQGDSRNGFAIGLRPELIVAGSGDHPRFGFGAFLEAQHGPHDASALGGGLTAVAYRDPFAAALSVGVDASSTGNDRSAQLVVSGFVGFRAPLDGAPLDAPFGLRVDVRPATSALPTSVMLGVSLDTAALAAAVYVLADVLHRHD